MKIEKKRSGGGTRMEVIASLTSLFRGLLAAFTGFGMLTHNFALLNHVFELVRYGMIVILVWAFGSAAKQVLTRWRQMR